MNENLLRHRTEPWYRPVPVTFFQCIHCQGDWAMVDFTGARPDRLSEYLHCPWCGVAQRAPLIEGGDVL